MSGFLCSFHAMVVIAVEGDPFAMTFCRELSLHHMSYDVGLSLSAVDNTSDKRLMIGLICVSM